MYCEHCGKKIDLDSVFCEHCGKKIKKINKLKGLFPQKHWKFIFIVFLVILFGGIFAWELQYFNSPNNALKRYLKNWTNENYDSILSIYGEDEKDFINQEILAEVAKENDEYLMTSFQVNSCEMDQNKKNAICYVSYHMKKNGLTYEKTYYLEKKNHRKLGIFSEWEIRNHDFDAVEDFKLFLPKDSTGTLIGKDIQNYREVSCDKSGYDCYMIPMILPGIYPLKVVMNTGMSLEKSIKVTEQGYTYQFNIADASTEFQEEAIQMASKVVEVLYNGVAEKKKFKDLECDLDLAALEKFYESFQKELANSFLVKMKVNQMKIKDMKLNDDGELLLTFQMSYVYDLKYKENDKEQDHHGESNDTFYITVKNVELKEIVKIDSLVTYFSKKY